MMYAKYDVVQCGDDQVMVAIVWPDHCDVLKHAGRSTEEMKRWCDKFALVPRIERTRWKSYSEGDRPGKRYVLKSKLRQK